MSTLRTKYVTTAQQAFSFDIRELPFFPAFSYLKSLLAAASIGNVNYLEQRMTHYFSNYNNAAVCNSYGCSSISSSYASFPVTAFTHPRVSSSLRLVEKPLSTTSFSQHRLLFKHDYSSCYSDSLYCFSTASARKIVPFLRKARNADISSVSSKDKKIAATKLRMQNSSNNDELSQSRYKNKRNQSDNNEDQNEFETSQEIKEDLGGLDDIDYYYGEEDDYEDTLEQEEYSLSEAEWLKMLAQGEVLENGGVDRVVGAFQENFEDLEQELLELEEALHESKAYSIGDEDDFWMIGENNDKSDEVKAALGNNFDQNEPSLMGWSGQTFPSVARTTPVTTTNTTTMTKQDFIFSGQTHLERALLQGVVPADAGVGSKSLPGDYGFDPLALATKDLFPYIQSFMLNILPPPLVLYNTLEKPKSTATPKRPKALILRDYREAEIRHGRLAMLAAVVWPLQELIDRAILPVEEYTFTVIYGGVTLPFLVMIMTLIMMLLGYLDVFASQIKEGEAGDAFLPGECFWDPLSVLDGAPIGTQRRMQERELMNGRMAMMAVAFYALQEAMTHKPFVELPWNQILFEPAYQIPLIRQWLDDAFGLPKSPSLLFPENGGQVDFIEMKENYNK